MPGSPRGPESRTAEISPSPDESPDWMRSFHDVSVSVSNARGVDQLWPFRLHLFIAPEWQKRSSAAAGSFIGSGGGASATGTTLNVSPDSIALVQSLVQSKRA